MARTVLITGTSSGIGRASARLFQSRGWNVVATMRSPERETESEALHHELAPLGVRVTLVEPGIVKNDFAGRSFDFRHAPAP